MKLTKDEKLAFDFVCNLASELTGRRGCNDLEKDQEEQFKHLSVKRDTLEDNKIVFDFDIIEWLRKQLELPEGSAKVRKTKDEKA